MENSLSKDELEIVEAIQKSLEGKNFGLITVELSILPQGFGLPKGQSTCKVTLIGCPSEVVITSISHRKSNNYENLDRR